MNLQNNKVSSKMFLKLNMYTIELCLVNLGMYIFLNLLTHLTPLSLRRQWFETWNFQIPHCELSKMNLHAYSSDFILS